MSNVPRIIVTGDIVEDIHVYVDPYASGGSRASNNTQLKCQAGGAALTHQLLTATAAHSIKLSTDDPKGRYVVRDPAAVALSYELPPDFGRVDDSGWPRSYGIFEPHSAGPKDRVWRAASRGGYSGLDNFASAATPLDFDGSPHTLVVDDGGLYYRHGTSRPSWPDFASAKQVIVKHSAPLCRGELWSELMEQCGDRMVLLVSSDDLRLQEAMIRKRLSWEQTALDTLRVVNGHPLLRELSQAATLVVNFRDVGALCVRRQTDGSCAAFLLFRPDQMEGEPGCDGEVYGYQACLLAALAHHLCEDSSEQSLVHGIAAGLNARRRLYECGHGEVGQDDPTWPFTAVADAIARVPSGLVRVDLPMDACSNNDTLDSWSILETQEPGPADERSAPMAGLGKLVVRYGVRALDSAPSLNIAPLFTADRHEIESLRALKRLIVEYEAVKVQKKPLSLAVFGPPGAGKSFAVKAIARQVLRGSELLEFNLSQFDGTSDLVGAFHQVRDAVLDGVTPIVFWDEFDSREYFWLQYLLAPMQDGAFQHDQVTHPIGKCVFVFAGGTSPSLERFGVAEPPEDGDAAEIDPGKLEKWRAEYAGFRLLKGPDFVSRLHGHLNILGPNPRMDGADRTYPIRRALMLRAFLRAGPHDVLHLDPGLVHALLTVPEYKHGARSFEKIVTALRAPGGGVLSRSALPALDILTRDVDAQDMIARMTQRDVYKTGIDIDKLAAKFHENYLNSAKAQGWTVQPRMQKDYEHLDADAKSANHGSALRVPELLELIDFRVEPSPDKDHLDWQKPLESAIERNIERLSQGEHLGWMEERQASGWRYGAKRDDEQLRHPDLVDWSKLTDMDKAKDSENVRLIPKILAMAGYRAVPG